MPLPTHLPYLWTIWKIKTQAKACVFKVNIKLQHSHYILLPIWYISKAMQYAKPVWYRRAKKVQCQLPISRLIAPIAAKHGDASNVKIINAYALAGVNMLWIVVIKVGSSSVASATPAKIPNVETTTSLAKKPVIAAKAVCQLSKPSGANTGAR